MDILVNMIRLKYNWSCRNMLKPQVVHLNLLMMEERRAEREGVRRQVRRSDTSGIFGRMKHCSSSLEFVTQHNDTTRTFESRRYLTFMYCSYICCFYKPLSKNAGIIKLYKVGTVMRYSLSEPRRPLPSFSASSATGGSSCVAFIWRPVSTL
jgi:hypothetical protein